MVRSLRFGKVSGGSTLRIFGVELRSTRSSVNSSQVCPHRSGAGTIVNEHEPIEGDATAPR